MDKRSHVNTLLCADISCGYSTSCNCGYECYRNIARKFRKPDEDTQIGAPGTRTQRACHISDGVIYLGHIANFAPYMHGEQERVCRYLLLTITAYLGFSIFNAPNNPPSEFYGKQIFSRLHVISLYLQYLFEPHHTPPHSLRYRRSEAKSVSQSVYVLTLMGYVVQQPSQIKSDVRWIFSLFIWGG